MRATLRELYGYIALLTGNGRAEAERHVVEVYRSLFQAARSGQLDSVTLGALRGAGRRLWLEEHRAELVAAEEVSTQPASTIGELSSLERAVLVLRHVNGLPVERVAAEIGRNDRDIRAVDTHAVRRLRGTDDTSGAWLRAYLGPNVTPSAGMVDRVIGRLGEVPPPTAVRPDRPLAAAEHGGDEQPDLGVDVVPEVLPESDVPEPDVLEPDVPEPDVPEPDMPEPDVPETRPWIAPSDFAGTPTAVEPIETPDEIHIARRRAPAYDEFDDDPDGDDPDGDDPDGYPASVRPLWPTVIAGVLLVALVGALVGLALTGDGDEVLESTPSTTGVSATSTTTSTTTTIEPVASPSDAVAIALGFDPPCTDAAQEGDPPLLAWADSLGPFGEQPTLTIEFPESVDVGADTERLPAVGRVLLRPDGAIVVARPADEHTADQTVMARVGFDGATVWSRCFDRAVEVRAEPDIGVDLAIRRGTDDTWTGLSLDDGTDTDLDSLQQAVLEEPVIPSSDTVDGPTLGFTYDAGLGRSLLTVFDDEDVLWKLPDLVLAADFRAERVGDVVLLQGCLPADGEPDCAGGSLQARDVRTGDVVWERTGLFHVPLVGDDLALIGSGSGWELLAVDSGEPVQSWSDADVFPCCDGVFEQYGGALVVIRPGLAEIWVGSEVSADAARAVIP